MQYMLLIYDDEDTWEQDGRGHPEPLWGTTCLHRGAQEHGKMVAGDALQPTTRRSRARARRRDRRPTAPSPRRRRSSAATTWSTSTPTTRRSSGRRRSRRRGSARSRSGPSWSSLRSPGLKYLALIYGDERPGPTSQEEQQAVYAQHRRSPSEPATSSSAARRPRRATRRPPSGAATGRSSDRRAVRRDEGTARGVLRPRVRVRGRGAGAAKRIPGFDRGVDVVVQPAYEEEAP